MKSSVSSDKWHTIGSILTLSLQVQAGSQLEDAFRQILECPICFNVPTQVVQCVNSHQICTQCQQKMQVCSQILFQKTVSEVIVCGSQTQKTPLSASTSSDPELKGHTKARTDRHL